MDARRAKIIKHPTRLHMDAVVAQAWLYTRNKCAQTT